jgi:hypothetical protein
LSTRKRERFKNRLWTKNPAKSRKIFPIKPEKNNFYTETCDFYTPFSPTCGKLFPDRVYFLTGYMLVNCELKENKKRVTLNITKNVRSSEFYGSS